MLIREKGKKGRLELSSRFDRALRDRKKEKNQRTREYREAYKERCVTFNDLRRKGSYHYGKFKGGKKGQERPGERFREHGTWNFRLAVEISGVEEVSKAQEIRKLLSLVNARLRLYTKYKRLALPEQVAAGAISRWRQAEKCVSISISFSLSSLFLSFRTLRFISTIKMEETPVDAKDVCARNRENLSAPPRKKKFSLKKEARQIGIV